MSIKNNTTSLQDLLEQVNNLPDAGGVELPELTNEGSADDLMLGKQLIDSEGNEVTGTFSIATEINEQDMLISIIRDAVNSLPEAGGSGGGSSFETCTVQFVQGDGPAGGTPLLVYYTDTDINPQILNGLGSFTVPKNTIIAIDGWSAMCKASGATQLFYLTGLAAYRISENAIFTIMG
jgi:hypothetical protein